MKYLFSALLLLNMAFFLWQYQKEIHEPPDVRSQQPQDDAVATLILASEVKNMPVAEGMQSGAATGEQGSGQGAPEEKLQEKTVSVCRTIGPFADSQSADQAASVLERAGVTYTRRQVEDRELLGYWVHLPEEKELAAARRILQDLKDSKISDVVIAPLDNGRYVISLGLFRKQNTLGSRQAQIKALGYSPVVVERFRTNTTVWIDVMDSEPSLPGPETWQALAGKFPAVNQTEISCR